MVGIRQARIKNWLRRDVNWSTWQRTRLTGKISYADMSLLTKKATSLGFPEHPVGKAWSKVGEINQLESASKPALIPSACAKACQGLSGRRKEKSELLVNT